MCFNKIIKLILIIFITSSNLLASEKENIIKNLQNISNLRFNFEQNNNGKNESGKCIVEYPKKIFCSYNLENEKKLISDGKFLVIKNKYGSYYKYPIKKTPLNFILDKELILNEIRTTKLKEINSKLISFELSKNESEIQIFFDKISFDLIGWQTTDLYQNLNSVYISSITKNSFLEKGLFKLPPMK